MLCLYAGTAFLASLAGGSLSSLLRLTHTRLPTAVSFIGGLMLGMALLHLIPHAAEETHSLDRAVGWALGGFLLMFLLQPIFHYHQHGVPEASEGGGHVAGCRHGPAPAPAVGHKLSWIAVALGLGFHSLLDGLALAAAVAAGRNSRLAWAGYRGRSQPRTPGLCIGLLRGGIPLYRVQRPSARTAFPCARPTAPLASRMAGLAVSILVGVFEGQGQGHDHRHGETHEHLQQDTHSTTP